MPYKEIVNLLRLFTVLQIFLVCGILLFHSQKKSTKNYLLAIIISSKAFTLLDALLISNYQIVFKYASNLLMLGSLFQLLLGPALYYFTINLTSNQNYSFKKHHLFHLIPFFFCVGFMIFHYHIYDYGTKLLLIKNSFPYKESWFPYLDYGIFFHYTIYGIFSLYILSKAREEICNISSLSVDRNLFYLKFVIIDLFVVFFLNTHTFIPMPRAFWIGLRIGTALNIFIIANAIVYQGLRFPEIFHGEHSNRQKYEKNQLTEQEKDRYSKRLLEFMATQKPYLNPTLSLADLASQLKIPSYALSQVLNVVLKKNFYDFINHYRVEESKALLRSISDDGKSVLETLYASGFNSKSVFNAAFKKHTGITPRRFKKLSLSEP